MKKIGILVVCLLFLLVGLVGGYVLRGQKTVTKTQTVFKPAPTISVSPLLPILPPVLISGSSPDQVVQTYYSWYLGCTRQHIASQSTLTLLTDCPFTTTGAVGVPYVNTLQTLQGKDPVLCSTTTPPSLTFEPATLQGPDKATVIVHGVYNKSGTNTSIRVGLQKDTNNQWKIQSITCE